MSEKMTKRLRRMQKREQGIVRAIKVFEEKGIRYRLCCRENGHFHIWSKDGKLYQYWASTDRIMLIREVGLDSLLELVE